MSSTDLLSQLRTIPGVEVDLSPAALASAQADKSGHKSGTAPLAVAYATTTEGIQEVMRFASAHAIPVVTRGGGSGLAGGAIGQAGEIVLSLERMNRILEISVDDRLARVEAGVINSDLLAAAGEHGLWFAPDPASRQWSTVGGNIATNAGGLLCAKYGVTKESVLELSVVLSDGRLIHTGHRSVKGVTGFDLTGLFIGSEGLLGVIVEATVKLLPISAHPVWTMAARFDDIDNATTACHAITSGGHTPAIMELIDAISLQHIHSHLELAPPPTGEVLLIAQADGSDANEQIAVFAGLCEKAGGSVVTSAEGPEADALLHLRRSMHPAMERLGHVLIEDVSVPRSQLGAMFHEIRTIEREHGVQIPTVAHAADGNLHPNFIIDGDVVPDHIWDAADELFRRAIALGGTLTGEHGVGLLKRRWLVDELGDDQWQLQRDIKSLFDPLCIMNPGKVFTH